MAQRGWRGTSLINKSYTYVDFFATNEARELCARVAAAEGGPAAGRAQHAACSLPGWQASQAPASRPWHATSQCWHGPACGIPQGEGRHARRRIPAARGLPSPASCQPAAGVGGKSRGGILWSFTYLSAGASGEGRRKVANLGHKIKFLIVGRRCVTKCTTLVEYFMVVAQLLQPLLGKRCGWWVAP